LEPYKALDHEADAGFEAYGHTEEELFQNSMYALFSLITVLGAIHPKTEKRFVVPDNNESLIVFLNELLYLWDVERFFPKTVEIDRTGVDIKVILKGEIYNEHRHAVLGAVKAVTYHKFLIRKEQKILKATFFVDM
jgi:SHS2 domain-containing protein